jgi:hypothetical protein
MNDILLSLMCISLDLSLKHFRYCVETAYVTVNEATHICEMISCLPSNIDVIRNAGII